MVRGGTGSMYALRKTPEIGRMKHNLDFMSIARTVMSETMKVRVLGGYGLDMCSV